MALVSSSGTILQMTTVQPLAEQSSVVQRSGFQSFDGLRSLPPSHTALASQHQVAIRAARLVVTSRRGGTQRFQLNTKKGTQIVRKGGKDATPEKKKGTMLFRFGQKDEDEGPKKGTQKLKFGGTQKIVLSEPTEVPAVPGPLYALTKLPFAAAILRGRPSDPKTVFVAGASGVTGVRIVLQLLSAGLTVRAGVEDMGEAQKLAEIASEFKQLVGPEEAKRLYVVQFGGEPEFTAKAIANAGAVVVTLGPGENGPSKNPMDAARALSIVTAATLARVGTFVLLSDFNEGAGGALGGLGGALTRVFAFLSGGRSTSYSDVREALAQAGEQGKLRYTVVRSGFWDGVPDSYAERSNLVVAPEGKITAGKITRNQVAGLLADILLKPKIGEYKVFDVVAKEGAEPVPTADLLSSIPVDPRRGAGEESEAQSVAAADAREKEKELRATAEAEARAAGAAAKAAAERQKTAEEEARRVKAEEAKAAVAAARAQAKAVAASAEVAALAQSLEEATAAVAAEPQAQTVIPSFASLVPKLPSPTPSSAAVAAAAAAPASGTASSAAPKQRRPLRQRGEAKPKAEAPTPAPAPAPTAAASAKKPEEKRGTLGGLFKQETVFADSDAGDF